MVQTVLELLSEQAGQWLLAAVSSIVVDGDMVEAICHAIAIAILVEFSHVLLNRIDRTGPIVGAVGKSCDRVWTLAIHSVTSTIYPVGPGYFVRSAYIAHTLFTD
jgi:hypothetical protein